MKPSLPTFRKPTYSRTNLRLDFSAALTIAFVALPQSMAYALIAGVEPRYGLYAFMTGSIIGALFGSTRHLQTGPTNATSVVVASSMAAFALHDQFMGLVFLLGFLAGAVQLLAGLFKLGNLTQFLSRSVLVGFMAGAALLIVVNQLPNLLGLPRSTSKSVFEGMWYAASHLTAFHGPTLLLGGGTLLASLAIERISPKSSRGLPLLPPYLLSILLAAVVVAALGLDEKGVVVVGAISGSLPPFSLPAFRWEYVQMLTPGAVAVALIGFAESVSSAKNVAAFAGDRFNADREFVGQGLAKIVAAFFSGMPVSGSPSRSVLCYRAGAVSRLSNVYAGVIVAVITLFFSSVARFIPLCALAGILLIIAANMIDWPYVRLALRSTVADRVALSVTFIAALLYPLDTAILIGVGISIALFLRQARRPNVIELNRREEGGFEEISEPEQRTHPAISIIHVEGDVFFGGVEFLEEEIRRHTSRPELRVLILRMKRAHSLDATSLQTLIRLHEDLTREGKLLLFSGASGQVERVFHKSGFDRLIGDDHIFYSGKTIFKSTREALDYALRYLAQSSPSVPPEE